MATLTSGTQGFLVISCESSDIKQKPMFSRNSGKINRPHDHSEVKLTVFFGSCGRGVSWVRPRSKHCEGTLPGCHLSSVSSWCLVTKTTRFLGKLKIGSFIMTAHWPILRSWFGRSLSNTQFLCFGRLHILQTWLLATLGCSTSWTKRWNDKFWVPRGHYA